VDLQRLMDVRINECMQTEFAALMKKLDQRRNSPSSSLSTNTRLDTKVNPQENIDRQKAKDGTHLEGAGSSAEDEGNGGTQESQPPSGKYVANRIFFPNVAGNVFQPVPRYTEAQNRPFNVSQHSMWCGSGILQSMPVWNNSQVQDMGNGVRGKRQPKGLDRGGTHLQE